MKYLGDLYEKYPKIFVQMKEGFFAISSGVPDTWIQTLDWMCGAIQGYIDNINENNPHLPPVPQLVCDQVKDKYGELRFYYHGGDDKCDGMVDLAEYILWETCEKCGSHENITTTDGWITRLCDKCKEL